MQHPEEGEIHEWLDGQMSAGRTREIEQHVAGCAECAKVVAEARGFIAASSRILSALDDVPGDVLPQAPPAATAADELAARRELARPRKRFTFPLRAAAVVLVAALGAVTLTRRTDRAREASRPVVGAAMENQAAVQDAAPSRAPLPVAQLPRAGDEAPRQLPARKAAPRETSLGGPVGSMASGADAGARARATAAQSAAAEAPLDAAAAPKVATGPAFAAAPPAPDAAEVARGDRRERVARKQVVGAMAAGSADMRPGAAPGSPTIAGCYRVEGADPPRALDLRMSVLDEERDPAARVLFVRGGGRTERASWVFSGMDSVRMDLERTSLGVTIRARAGDGVLTGVGSDGKAFSARRSGQSPCE